MRLPRSLVLLPLALLACSPSGRVPLLAEPPLHLEERLAGARIEGAEIPQNLLDLLPPEAGYTQAPVGVVTESRGRISRQALYFHVPAKLWLRVRIPNRKARLDFGLGVLRYDAPVKFRIKADSMLMFSSTWADPEHWSERSIKLSRFAGQTITLQVQVVPAKVAEGSGTVALWAAPTLVSDGG